MIGPETTPRARVGITLIEQSCRSEVGGGFEETRWKVFINDDWFDVARLIERRRVGDVSVEVESEDDPDGASSLPIQWLAKEPGVWWKRQIYVVAPLRTQFCKVVRRPMPHLADAWGWGVPYGEFETDFEIRGEERLVSLHVLAERAKRNARLTACSESKPLTPEEHRRYAEALLAALDGRRDDAEAAQ